MIRSQITLGTLLIVSSLMGCKPEFLMNAADLKTSTTQALEQRNFADAVQQAKKLVDKAPDDHQSHYLLAQAQAQAGDRSAALMSLEKAIKAGFKDDKEITSNPKLDPLRDMSAYADLMSKNFPDSSGASVSIPGTSKAVSGNVSIQESPDGRQVIRAGDVVIETTNK